MADGPDKQPPPPKGEKTGGGGRSPDTKHLLVKDNTLSKESTSGGPGRGYTGGGKQGKYRQPY